jgi:hypothetical protein
MKIRVALAYSVLLSCSYSTMRSTTYEPATGRQETKIFSKFFEGSTVLRESTAGLLVIVEVEKRRIPVLYELRAMLGLLPFSDLVGTGVVTTIVYNLSPDAIDIELTRMVNKTRPAMEVQGLPYLMRIEPNSHGVATLGPIETIDLDEEITFEISSVVSAIPTTSTVTVQRQTVDDIRARSGPDGVRPRLAWKP